MTRLQNMPKHNDPQAAQLAVDFSERLRHAMSVRGISRKKLEEIAGVGVGHVSRVASGKRTALPETIQRLATALKVDPGWLAFGVHQMDFTLPGTVEWPGVCRAAQEAIRFARFLGVSDDDVREVIAKLDPIFQTDAEMVFSAIMHVARHTTVRKNIGSTPPPEATDEPLLAPKRKATQREGKVRRQS